MAGQPTPPRLVEAFAANAAAGFINAIPITTADVFAASLDLGFPPTTFLDPANGGVLPSGADFNGILNLVSAWAAFLGAGQIPAYDATLQAAMGGYALGARIQQAANTSAVWVSTVSGNMTDPDTGGAGWLSSVPLYSSSSPTAGAHTDNALPGPSDYFLDYDTTLGNVTLNAFVAQRNGQRITLSNTGANLLNIGVNVGTAANRVRANAGPLTILQNDSLTIQYVSAISRWVVV